jgi:hypothetical protein
MSLKSLTEKLQVRERRERRERREGCAKNAKENQRKPKMEKTQKLDAHPKATTALSHLKNFGIPFAPFA